MYPVDGSRQWPAGPRPWHSSWSASSDWPRPTSQAWSLSGQHWPPLSCQGWRLLSTRQLYNRKCQLIISTTVQQKMLQVNSTFFRWCCIYNITNYTCIYMYNLFLYNLLFPQFLLYPDFPILHSLSYQGFQWSYIHSLCNTADIHQNFNSTKIVKL